MHSALTFEDIDGAEIERRTALFGPLADAVRELIDATIRTTADEDAVREAESRIRAVTETLRAGQIEGSFGIRYTPQGLAMSWGNAAMGLRNPLAPPLHVESDDSGLHWSEFVLGAAYEGPPWLVHGGICALVLDQVAGLAASSGDKPNLTGMAIGAKSGIWPTFRDGPGPARPRDHR
ncbi:PaaI family thioesterase [Nocardia takedensis]